MLFHFQAGILGPKPSKKVRQPIPFVWPQFGPNPTDRRRITTEAEKTTLVSIEVTTVLM